MSTNGRKSLLSLTAFLILILSCKVAAPWMGEEEIAELVEVPEEFYDLTDNPDSELRCNSTGDLHIEVDVTLDEVNQYQTELNEYSLRIKNSSSTKTIFLMGYNHKADIYQNLDERKWVQLAILTPGEIDKRDVYKTIYHEKDAEGPTLLLIEKLAGVREAENCKPWKSSEKYLDSIAVNIDYP